MKDEDYHHLMTLNRKEEADQQHLYPRDCNSFCEGSGDKGEERGEAKGL